MATATASLLVKPASKEELEAFITANKRWLPEDAKQVLRDMTAVDQRRVISAGTMSSVRDPSAVIQARVRKAKELEVSLSRNGGVLPPDMTGQESRISKPATKEELEAFVRANDRWLQGEAAEILRSMSPVDQKRVISAGTMSGCRDPVAVIQTRAKKARELELELENLAAGKGSLKKEGSAPVTSTPSFCEAAAAAHLYAPPEEVDVSESRFARAVDAADLADNSSLAGESPGVGGVVEILKAKYGCFKGQRIQVIGESGSLLQFEGGKTAPKNHENLGWKWVIRAEEESKTSAAQAQLAAMQLAAARQQEQVAAQKAAELARQHAEAKARAEAVAAAAQACGRASPASRPANRRRVPAPARTRVQALRVQSRRVQPREKPLRRPRR
eukprot:TRINITY_DN4024_c0_g4_i2.p1 TRINITY_DN4024_c0_g4~~TRINITY_DN4024_c0_g4_i2.p1  ORF type:complete len:388 (+),score=101.77 TRINITY_DN4024_c0_g4_i2:61-1224(+)